MPDFPSERHLEITHSYSAPPAPELAELTKSDDEIAKECPENTEPTAELVAENWRHLDLRWSSNDIITLDTPVSIEIVSIKVTPQVPKYNHSQNSILVKLHQTPVVTDYKGGPVLNVFREFLNNDELKQLLETTKILEKAATNFKPDKKRGVDKVLHLGCWRCYAKVPFVTKQSRTAHAEK
jgi:hypothetical protein